MEGSWIVGFIEEILSSFAQEFGQEAAQQVLGQYNDSKFSPYVCCFSEDGDMLSQWRGYANDGHGFSIGFNSELFPCPTGIPRKAFNDETKLWLCKLEYQVDIQQKFIRRLLELAMRDVTAKAGEIPLGVQEQIAYMSAKMSAKNNGMSLPEIPCGGLHELIRQLTGYAVIAKNTAFHEEREHRLIHAPLVIADQTTNKTTYSRFEISDPKHRVTNNRICAYYEFDFSEYISKGIIAEIVKGPKNGTSDNDLDAIFGKMECTNIPIRQSKASYR